MRLEAIYKAFYYGLLPYWCYEKERHYSCSYFQHLIINVKYAWRWITFNEDQSDIEFEINTNKQKRHE